MITDTLLECPYCQSDDVEIIDEAKGLAECMSCYTEFEVDSDD